MIKGYGKASMGKGCFNCGGSDHWSKECPYPPRDKGKGKGKMGMADYLAAKGKGKGEYQTGGKLLGRLWLSKEQSAQAREVWAIKEYVGPAGG